MILGRWLEGSGFSPLYALLFMGFLPALVLDRVAMNDLPNALCTTLGLSLRLVVNQQTYRVGGLRPSAG